MGLEILAGKVPVIAIMGAKYSGKSLIADALVSRGFKQFAFADKVKEAVMLIYGLSHDQVYGDLKEIVDARYGISPRFIMQRFATEVCRSIHPDTWVMALEQDVLRWGQGRRYPEMGIVIDDLRFPNETEYIKRWGGQIWEVVRTGNDYTGEHSSEERVPIVADRTIYNLTTPEQLHEESIGQWVMDCHIWNHKEYI